MVLVVGLHLRPHLLVEELLLQPLKSQVQVLEVQAEGKGRLQFELQDSQLHYHQEVLADPTAVLFMQTQPVLETFLKTLEFREDLDVFQDVPQTLLLVESAELATVLLLKCGLDVQYASPLVLETEKTKSMNQDLLTQLELPLDLLPEVLGLPTQEEGHLVDETQGNAVFRLN